MTHKKIGRVIDYDAESRMALVELSGTLCVGDRIRIKGPRSDWRQFVEALYIDHKPVTQAGAGQIVMLTVTKRADKGDQVFVILQCEPKPEPKPKSKSKPKPKPKPRPKPPSKSGSRPKPTKEDDDDDDNDEDDEPDLPDPDHFEEDNNGGNKKKKKKKKNHGMGG